MGIRTRGVSLSLESLGIAVPRSNNTSASRTNRSPSNPSPAAAATDSPPTKRLKRSHTQSSASPAPLRHASSAADPARLTENTPPPSPGNAHIPKIDTQGINDEIVVAVLEQLQSTGNRPHLIKELATILSNKLKIVESSSNPQAIISSRLTNYLRRPWSAIAPCPLAKEQVVVHPRRVYFFLTTCPRQPIPEFADARPPTAGTRVISPSASSGAEEDVDMMSAGATDDRQRQSRSPSPELDLTYHDMDLAQPEQPDAEEYTTSRLRGQSPPLEHDEREFSQTASVLQARKQSEQSQTGAGLDVDSFPSNGLNGEHDPYIFTFAGADENDEAASLRNHETAAALFGGVHAHLLGGAIINEATLYSSPLMRPVASPMMRAKDLPIGFSVTTPTRKAFDLSSGWSGLGDVRSPEAVGLNELDDILGEF